MSAKYRNMVALTWNGPNGRFMKKATTDREVGRLCRKYGMPADVEALRVKTGETRTEADKLPLSGQIPSSHVNGLISVKSRIEDSSGTTAQPMTFRVEGLHNGVNASKQDAYIEPGLLRAEWATATYDIRSDKTDELVGSAARATERDIYGYLTPVPDFVLEAVQKATNPTLSGKAFIMDENGAKVQVPAVGPETWTYRLGTPATHRDGTPMPEPGTYLIYGENGPNKPKLTQEDMNRVTADEAVQLQRMCMNMCRSRDAQRITKKSDISSKSDGADMWDAMQDSVLYYAQQIKWADSLPIVAYDVESREPSHWSIIPAKAKQMAADADILGEEFDITAYTVNMSKKSLMWQAVRNAMHANFTVPEQSMRAFKAMFIKADIDDKTGEIATTLEEYTQITNNGAPGYSLLYPDRFQANYDGTHQASAEPARSGWTLRLRNGKGGSSRKPQHVAIGSLRTSTDNPYNDVRFRAAWGNGEEYPILRVALELGINADDLHKAGLWAKLAEIAHPGKKVTWKDIKALKAQATQEWANLRESLGYVEELTGGTDAPHADNAVDVADL